MEKGEEKVGYLTGVYLEVQRVFWRGELLTEDIWLNLQVKKVIKYAWSIWGINNNKQAEIHLHG